MCEFGLVQRNSEKSVAKRVETYNTTRNYSSVPTLSCLGANEKCIQAENWLYSQRCSYTNYRLINLYAINSECFVCDSNFFIQLFLIVVTSAPMYYPFRHWAYCIPHTMFAYAFAVARMSDFL